QVKTVLPDVIFLDLGLPDNNGVKAVEYLKNGWAQIPIIIVTGGNDVENAVKAIELGAQDYLIKDELDEKQLERSTIYSIKRNKYGKHVNVSERDYRLLFENSPIPMHMFDENTLDILQVN